MLVSPLAQRECAALFGSQLVSGLGDWAGRLALAVVVFDRSGSTLWTAAVTVVALLPWLGPGQMLATLADRLGRVRIMVAADLVRAVLFAVMAAPLPTWALLVAAFLAGSCVPPFVAARGAAVVDVVRARAVRGSARAVRRHLTGRGRRRLRARWRRDRSCSAPGPTLVVNAVTFLGSALLVWSIRKSAASDRHRRRAARDRRCPRRRVDLAAGPDLSPRLCSCSSGSI